MEFVFVISRIIMWSVFFGSSVVIIYLLDCSQ